MKPVGKNLTKYGTGARSGNGYHERTAIWQNGGSALLSATIDAIVGGGYGAKGVVHSKTGNSGYIHLWTKLLVEVKEDASREYPRISRSF